LNEHQLPRPIATQSPAGSGQIDSPSELAGPQEKRLMAAGVRSEGELRAGESKWFQISLNRGVFARIIAEQLDVDLSIYLYTADNKLIAEMDGPTGDRGNESISLIADADSDYVIELRTNKSASPAGRFKISIDGPRDPTPTDLIRIWAERSYTTARKLTGDDDSKLAAITLYKDAVKLFEDVGDRYEKAKALLSLARVIWVRSDRAAEAEVDGYDTQVINLSREIGDVHLEALTLRHLTLMYITSDPRKALGYATQSLELFRKEAHRNNEAIAINTIGGAFENLGDPQGAFQCYQEALSLQKELNDVVGIANMLNNIGQIYDRLGESQEALTHFQQSIDLLASTPHIGAKPLAAALNNTAYTLLAVGDAQGALEYSTRSLPLQREAENVLGEVGTLLNIGYSHLQLGNPTTALSFYETADQLCRTSKRDIERAYVLMYIGEADVALGRVQAARSRYFEALQILNKKLNKEGKAIALTRIAALSAAEGDLSGASNGYDEALVIWQALKDPRGEAATLFGIAQVERTRGNLAEAHKRAEAAIKKIEMLRVRVVSRELRTSYLASVRDYYDLDIDILMQLHKRQPFEGFDSRALQLSEHARARSFLESFGEIGQEIREGVDPKLLGLEQSLQTQIEAKIQLQVGLLKDKATEKQAAQIDAEIKALITERKDVDEKIRVQSPRYATLIQPQPIGVEETQQKLLDPDTLLLEYALGEQRSYLWLVSASQIKSYELPGRTAIEASASQVYNLVKSSEAVFPRGKAAYWQKAAALSQMILGPVAAELGDKRLLIVGEGALQYVPFNALPIPQGASRNVSRAAPLIAEHEIVSLPSISVAAALRAELTKRKPAGKGVVVFADPVFGLDDDRFDLARNRVTMRFSQGEEPKRRGGLREFAKYGIKLDRLKNSRAEAEAIRSMSTDARINVDFDANLQNARSADLSSYRIVHFATHGLLDSNQPDLSCIALSLVNAAGVKQDGFLLLNDIYNLKLSADLVVLSACSTALGKDIKGEGLVGLTRGFMYAGAARVMASLWNVDDQRTAELMKRFYEKVLKEKMQPAAALRAAQLEMWRGRNNSPYYWGAFILQGEWR